jgi:hypothetical protein
LGARLAAGIEAIEHTGTRLECRCLHVQQLGTASHSRNFEWQAQIHVEICGTWDPGSYPPGKQQADVQVPFLFKYTVDALATPGMQDPQVLATAGLASPVLLLLAYGCARAGSTMMSELRNVIFAKVAQGTIRKVSNQVITTLWLSALVQTSTVPCTWPVHTGACIQPPS